MRSQRGYSLTELMLYVALLSVLTIALGTFADAVYRSNRLAVGYADQLSDSQRALSTIERDIRTAHVIEEVGSDRLVLRADTELVQYVREGDRVVRQEAGVRQLLPGRSAGFSAQRRPRTVYVKLEVPSPVRDRRPLTLSTTVAPRAGERTR